jgi:hypothetical protein
LSEKLRLFVICVSCLQGWIHLSTLSSFAGPLQIEPPTVLIWRAALVMNVRRAFLNSNARSLMHTAAVKSWVDTFFDIRINVYDKANAV